MTTHTKRNAVINQGPRVSLCSRSLRRKCCAENDSQSIRTVYAPSLASPTPDHVSISSAGEIILIIQPCTCFWVWFPWLHTSAQITHIWQDSSFCGNQTSHNTTNWALCAVVQERSRHLGFQSAEAGNRWFSSPLGFECELPAPIVLTPPGKTHGHQELARSPQRGATSCLRKWSPGVGKRN